MTSQMERNKKTPLLFSLLLALLHVSAVQNCPKVPDNVRRNLTCESDYNRTITCVWNSTYVSDHPDSVCTISARWKGKYTSLSSSCELKPVDASQPTLKKCSMMLKRGGATEASDYVFQTFQNFLVSLSCEPVTQSLSIFFKPSCHIKLNPPPKPDINQIEINFTTISWLPQIIPHEMIEFYCTQLQWKREDQSWSDPKESCRPCKWNCATELIPDELIQGERYMARVRVKDMDYSTNSPWSDWSPTASWVSSTGRTNEPKPSTSDFSGVFGIIAGAAAVAVFLVVLHYKTDKTIWVYMVKRIRGPPIPNPEKSFLQDGNFLSWLSPHFNSESFNSIFKPVEIVSVEVTSIVDAVTPCGPETALLEKMRSESSHKSTSSNYSNPSYSQLCPPAPVTSLTAGNLPACTADTPYGPVGSQSEGKNEQQDSHEVRGKEVEIHQLLSKDSNSSEPMPMISDYEKVEKVQVERSRLQSLDSGMCSGEEVSQESLEADSITMTDHDEGPEGEEEREGGNEKETDFKKLFGGGGDSFGKGSIQVCSGYEQVQKLQADSPELPSLDSGISSGGEEQVSQEESLEDADKSTEFTSLLLPPPFSALPCSLPSFSPLPLNFSGPGFSPALQPLSSHLLERIALLPTDRSVEPSGDGYMPVRQEQS